MSTREQRVKVFQDTLEWIKNDNDLTAAVIASKKATRVYIEDDYPYYSDEISKEEQIIVTGERSFEAAIRLHKEFPGKKIAVMNFANAFQPGGGVTKGSSAQEESLCRTSTLYPLIYRKSLRETYYKHHHTPKASDALIYTEGVVICKTDEDIPRRMPKEDWVKIDVITIAAPDLRDSSNIYVPVKGNGTEMKKAELFGYHVKRALHMLTVSAHKRADILVLGAFGCGAFQNDPHIVASAFKTALEVFPKVFDQVIFAVYCPPGGSYNHDVFSKVMSGVSEKSGNTDKGKAPNEEMHSGFEGPTIGIVHPKGSKVKRNPDGTISIIHPKK